MELTGSTVGDLVCNDFALQSNDSTRGSMKPLTGRSMTRAVLSDLV